MAKHKVVTTNAEIDGAIEQAQGLKHEPRVLSVEYKRNPGLDLLILKLSDGRRHLIPREELQGLQSATKEQVAAVEIVGQGTGLHWPALDVDHYVPSLLRRVYGNRNWMAEIGRNGGSARSVAKKKASRANGLKGGRPRQKEPAAMTG
jgi:hypothetical protein